MLTGLRDFVLKLCRNCIWIFADGQTFNMHFCYFTISYRINQIREGVSLNLLFICLPKISNIVSITETFVLKTDTHVIPFLFFNEIYYEYSVFDH